MGRILIQDDPDFLRRIPAPDALHETTQVGGILSRIECPMDFSAVHVIEEEQIEAPSGFLPFFQYQGFR
jgi:hypothetical protein